MYQHVRYLSIICMMVSLVALIILQEQSFIAVFFFSAILLFGVVVLECRHQDTVKDLELSLSTLSAFSAKNQKKTDDLEQSVQHLIDLNKKLASDCERLSQDVSKVDADKIKSDIKTLIESNNQMVMKMSMGQAFGGM